jgi:ABC-type Mn2+/Zn2+ transport system ATPase subunit
VAYLGQFHPSAFILPLRVIDVVRMARFSTHGVLGRITAEDERFVREAMEIMGVLDLKDKPLNMLSGGQRQRVFIAQAFARHANLILLDEPTMNLDTTAREIYQKMIRDATAAGCSTVIATHDITEASECDMALLLARRVVAYGRGCEVLTPEVLLSTFGVIARYEEGRAVVYRGHGHECDDV